MYHFVFDHRRKFSNFSRYSLISHNDVIFSNHDLKVKRLSFRSKIAFLQIFQVFQGVNSYIRMFYKDVKCIQSFLSTNSHSFPLIPFFKKERLWLLETQSTVIYWYLSMFSECMTFQSTSRYASIAVFFHEKYKSALKFHWKCFKFENKGWA